MMIHEKSLPGHYGLEGCQIELVYVPCRYHEKNMTFLRNLFKIFHEKMSLEWFELTSLFQFASILWSKIANFQGLKSQWSPHVSSMPPSTW